MLLGGCIALLIKCWMIRLIPQSQPHYTVFIKEEVTGLFFFAWCECGEDFLVKFVGGKACGSKYSFSGLVSSKKQQKQKVRTFKECCPVGVDG